MTTEVTIKLYLENCLKCPYVRSEPCYTGDPWEHANRYFCSEMNKREIANYIEWHGEMPSVPDWCPIKSK